jgi:hypothetical protein
VRLVGRMDEPARAAILPTHAGCCTPPSTSSGVR